MVPSIGDVCDRLRSVVVFKVTLDIKEIPLAKISGLDVISFFSHSRVEVRTANWFQADYTDCLLGGNLSHPAQTDLGPSPTHWPQFVKTRNRSAQHSYEYRKWELDPADYQLIAFLLYSNIKHGCRAPTCIQLNSPPVNPSPVEDFLYFCAASMNFCLDSKCSRCEFRGK